MSDGCVLAMHDVRGYMIISSGLRRLEMPLVHQRLWKLLLRKRESTHLYTFAPSEYIFSNFSARLLGSRILASFPNLKK